MAISASKPKEPCKLSRPRSASTSDGVVGPQTWDKFEEVYGLPPYPPPLPELDPQLAENILSPDRAVAHRVV